MKTPSGLSARRLSTDTGPDQREGGQGQVWPKSWHRRDSGSAALQSELRVVVLLAHGPEWTRDVS